MYVSVLPKKCYAVSQTFTIYVQQVLPYFLEFTYTCARQNASRSKKNIWGEETSPISVFWKFKT